jgi:hypothetical protein
MSVYGKALKTVIDETEDYNELKTKLKEMSESFDNKRSEKGETLSRFHPSTNLYVEGIVFLLSPDGTEMSPKEDFKEELEKIEELYGKKVRYGKDVVDFSVHVEQEDFGNFFSLYVSAPQGRPAIWYSIDALESEEMKNVIDNVAGKLGITTELEY